MIILSSISIAPFTGYKTLPHLFITHNQEVGISAIFRNEVIGIQASFSKVPWLGVDGTKMLACLLISNTALGALCSSCLSLRDQDLFTSFPSCHLRIGHHYFPLLLRVWLWCYFNSPKVKVKAPRECFNITPPCLYLKIRRRQYLRKRRWFYIFLFSQF